MAGFLCELVMSHLVIMAAVITLIMAIERPAVMVPQFMVLPTDPTEVFTDEMGAGKAESILAGKQPFSHFRFSRQRLLIESEGDRRWENAALLGLVLG